MIVIIMCCSSSNNNDTDNTNNTSNTNIDTKICIMDSPLPVTSASETAWALIVT